MPKVRCYRNVFPTCAELCSRQESILALLRTRTWRSRRTALWMSSLPRSTHGWRFLLRNGDRREVRYLPIYFISRAEMFHRSVAHADYPVLETIAASAIKDKQPFERLVVSKENLLKMFEVCIRPSSHSIPLWVFFDFSTTNTNSTSLTQKFPMAPPPPSTVVVLWSISVSGHIFHTPGESKLSWSLRSFPFSYAFDIDSKRRYLELGILFPRRR
jgi:hypothetical protein